MTDDQIGDGPIEEDYRMKMQVLAEVIDGLFNGEAKGHDRTTGFVLLVFPFNDDLGRCNYISNADKRDIVQMLKEQVKKFERDMGTQT